MEPDKTSEVVAGDITMVPIEIGAQSDAAESISRANLKKIDPTLRSKPEARQLNVGNAIQSFDDDGVYL